MQNPTPPPLARNHQTQLIAEVLVFTDTEVTFRTLPTGRPSTTSRERFDAAFTLLDGPLTPVDPLPISVIHQKHKVLIPKEEAAVFGLKVKAPKTPKPKVKAEGKEAPKKRKKRRPRKPKRRLSPEAKQERLRKQRRKCYRKRAALVRAKNLLRYHLAKDALKERLRIEKLKALGVPPEEAELIVEAEKLP